MAILAKLVVSAIHTNRKFTCCTL